MPQPILHELAHHHLLRERLEAEFPDADEETLKDTLEGMTNLSDSLAELLRSSLEDQTLVSALRGRISDMQERCGRFETRARKKRELVCSVMEEADIWKLVEPDFTVSLRPGRAPLVIMDEEAIPGGYWKPQPSMNGTGHKGISGKQVKSGHGRLQTSASQERRTPNNSCLVYKRAADPKVQNLRPKAINRVKQLFPNLGAGLLASLPHVC